MKTRKNKRNKLIKYYGGASLFKETNFPSQIPPQFLMHLNPNRHRKSLHENAGALQASHIAIRRTKPEKYVLEDLYLSVESQASKGRIIAKINQLFEDYTSSPYMEIYRDQTSHAAILFLKNHNLERELCRFKLFAKVLAFGMLDIFTQHTGLVTVSKLSGRFSIPSNCTIEFSSDRPDDAYYDVEPAELDNRERKLRKFRDKTGRVFEKSVNPTIVSQTYVKNISSLSDSELLRERMSEVKLLVDSVTLTREMIEAITMSPQEDGEITSKNIKFGKLNKEGNGFSIIPFGDSGVAAHQDGRSLFLNLSLVTLQKTLGYLSLPTHILTAIRRIIVIPSTPSFNMQHHVVGISDKKIASLAALSNISTMITCVETTHELDRVIKSGEFESVFDKFGVLMIIYEELNNPSPIIVESPPIRGGNIYEYTAYITETRRIVASNFQKQIARQHILSNLELLFSSFEYTLEMPFGFTTPEDIMKLPPPRGKYEERIQTYYDYWKITISELQYEDAPRLNVATVLTEPSIFGKDKKLNKLVQKVLTEKDSISELLSNYGIEFTYDINLDKITIPDKDNRAIKTHYRKMLEEFFQLRLYIRSHKAVYSRYARGTSFNYNVANADYVSILNAALVREIDDEYKKSNEYKKLKEIVDSSNA